MHATADCASECEMPASCSGEGCRWASYQAHVGAPRGPRGARPRAALLALTALAALAAAPVRAGFVVTCDRLAVGRIDPIVDPGNWSTHVHNFFGSNALSKSTTFADTQRPGTCTSCSISNDRSLYWQPALYHRHPQTRALTIVPAPITRIYYTVHKTPQDVRAVQEFPPGFRMMAGNARVTAPLPLGITWKCIGPSKPGMQHVTSFGGSFPDMMCQTWSAGVVFPNCWNGKPANPANVTAHTSYPMFRAYTGPCPPTHPFRLPLVNMSIMYDLSAFQGASPSDFLLSNGDRRGYSLHADMLNGWTPGALQRNLPCSSLMCGSILPRLQGTVQKAACLLPDGVSARWAEQRTSTSTAPLFALPGNPCPPGRVCTPVSIGG